MTNRQEEELFRTLGNLVGGVKQIQETLDGHTKILDDHTKKLDDHSAMLRSLVSKTDSIADQVLKNDQRLTARISSVENAVENLGGDIH